MNDRKFWALSPLFIFLLIYISSGILTGDFYKIPTIVPFLAAAIFSLIMNKKETMSKKIEIFTKGAGNSDIILMCLIFILSGAFAQVAKDAGSVDSTVNLGLSILPSNILIVGIFIIACFISLSIGTSVGTIVALSPMATSVATKANLPIALALGAVVGGAMFGDNLSIISDTTIAATKTQGCELKDKFKLNFKIVFPAAIITAFIFAFLTPSTNISIPQTSNYNIVKIIPYVFVLISALLGVNVLIVLITGTLLSGIIGLIYNSFNLIGLMVSIGNGINSMSELIIISLLIGGMVELIKFNGGIDYILSKIKNKKLSKKSAELSIGLLVSLVDICTANNTIAIVMTGPLAKNISQEFNIDPRRSASLLDTFSCFAQGMIPYGAQLLAAASYGKVSPFSIMKYLYYPYLMVLCTLIAIATGFPKLKETH